MHHPATRPIMLLFIATMGVSVFSGCDMAKDALRRGVVAQVRAIQGERGFHVVDGEAVFNDFNLAEGRITRKLPGVDIQTFRAMKQPRKARALFAVDANNVFIGYSFNVARIDGADAKTFEILIEDGTFSRDSRYVYYLGAVLENADPTTFQMLEAPFGKDANRAYLGTIPIPVEDIESWRPLGKGLAELPWRGEWNKVNAPPNHHALTGFGWSKDRLRVYWGENPLAQADAETFVALSRYYGKDKNHVFFAEKIVQDADAATFVTRDGPFIENTDIYRGPGPDSHDAQRQFKSGKEFIR